MLKLRGFAAEDLNGFLDEGTEFSGAPLPRRAAGGRPRQGRIVSDNTLIIGETGQVDAEIDCGVVSIRAGSAGRSTAANASSCSPAAGCRRRSFPPSS